MVDSSCATLFYLFSEPRHSDSFIMLPTSSNAYNPGGMNRLQEDLSILCSGIAILMIGFFGLRAVLNMDRCLDISGINACLVMGEGSRMDILRFKMGEGHKNG